MTTVLQTQAFIQCGTNTNKDTNTNTNTNTVSHKYKHIHQYSVAHSICKEGHRVFISGDTLLWDNRRIFGKLIIVLAQPAQSTHN